jgi:hypothetical protein
MNPSRASSGTLVRRRSKLRVQVRSAGCEVACHGASLWVVLIFMKYLLWNCSRTQNIISSHHLCWTWRFLPFGPALIKASLAKTPRAFSSSNELRCLVWFSSSSWWMLVSSLVYRLHRPQRFHGVNLIVQSSLMFVVSAAWLSRQKKI